MLHMGKDKWVIWFENDEVSPIAAVASDRDTAWKIGQRARPNKEPTAVIREDEGANITVADKKLSTIGDPTRFITDVLNESKHAPDTGEMNSVGKTVENYISSDTTVFDVLDGDSIR